MSEGMMPQPPPGEAPPLFEPKRLKVFGVIHIVFGGLGLLYMVINIVAMLFRDAFEKMGTAGQPEEMVEFQRQFNEATQLSSWITIAMGVVVSVLILIAGIALVRRKKNALKLSNTYAFASLGAKAVNIILFITMISPALNKLMDDMAGEAPADVKDAMNIAKAAAMAAGIVVPVIMALYPILTLALLNRPPVKDYLAQQGT